MENQLSYNRGIKLSLYVNYFVFAILLNSVGIVILKSQEIYGVDEVQASVLEGFKDLPIAIVSFIIASFLPRIGYKKGMLIALALVALGCLQMVLGNSFLSAKILFALVGVSFAIIKVSVYSTIGIITAGEGEHNSLMSSIEGVFMFGVALAYFLFPAFNTSTSETAWLNVYWLLIGMCAVSFILLFFSKFDDNVKPPGKTIAEDFKQMFALMARILVLVFVASAFLFVMIEQGIMTWLPSFNKSVLNLSENLAIMMASILAISLGLGRIIAGYLAKIFNWFSVLTVCIIIAALLLIFLLPQAFNLEAGTVNSLKDASWIAFAFPMIGLFIAPIYPLLNSTILSSLPQNLHSPMSGLIIIFSALGGTLGSRLIGLLFRDIGAESAFLYLLVPLAILFVCMFFLRSLSKKIVVK